MNILYNFVQNVGQRGRRLFEKLYYLPVHVYSVSDFSCKRQSENVMLRLSMLTIFFQDGSQSVILRGKKSVFYVI